MRWLERAMGSALSCTLPCEIVIVDDGSSDGSREWLKARAVADSRIRLFLNESDRGLVQNWNRCLEHASGEWIKFLFQDDFWEAGTLEKLYSLRKDRPFLVARRNYVFEENASLESRRYYTEIVQTLDRVAPGKVDFSPAESSRLIAKSPVINFIGEPSTVMFQRDMVSDLGNFNVRFRQICDLEYWCRIVSVYGMTYCPEVEICFAVHDNSQSALNAAKKSSARDPLLLVRELLYGMRYQNFRNYLSAVQKRKLILWLGTHAAEEFRKAGNDGKLDEFRSYFSDAPEVIRSGSSALNYYLAKAIRLLLRK